MFLRFLTNKILYRRIVYKYNYDGSLSKELHYIGDEEAHSLTTSFRYEYYNNSNITKTYQINSSGAEIVLYSYNYDTIYPDRLNSVNKYIKINMDDVLMNMKFGSSLKKVGSFAGEILITTDIAYSIYENYISNSATWFSSIMFDISKMVVQSLISLTLTALIPGFGWAIGLATNIILENLFEVTGVNGYIEGRFNDFEKKKNEENFRTKRKFRKYI